MKKIISAVAAAAVSLGCIAGINVFADDAVDYVIKEGIMEGYSDNDLQLDKAVTRAEFAKMIYEAYGMKDEGKSTFSDVSKEHWAYKYISKIADIGLINGFDDGTFRPEEHITYEQAVKIIVTASNKYEKKYPEGYISYAIDNNLLENVGTVMGENITRLDAANLIYNIADLFVTATPDPDNGESADDFEHNMTYPGGSNSAGGGGSASGAAGSGSSEIIVNPNFNHNTESYANNEENIFKNAVTSPFSTFSIDTDTASYSNMRRFILQGKVPPKDSVRSEELINYFDYDYNTPDDGSPFAVNTEIGVCPWNEENQLAMITLKGREQEEKVCSNLVFLIDVSGSMYSVNKLPLVQKSMGFLLDNLQEGDTVSIVTYASGVRTVLEGADAEVDRERIIKTINSLSAGGGTNGNGGLQMAYDIAEKYKREGNNRIILCTDGDFNIGPSSNTEMKDMISKKRESKVYISVLGFGIGNYKDDKLEIIADNGNGGYYYIDNLREAKKVLSDEMTKNIYTVADDVKIQVEFNPSQVKEYRLVGYENRVLETEDFENDKKDAGELGAGASVTAFYEIVPADGVPISDSRYTETTFKDSDELMLVKLRYKNPGENESLLKEYPIEKTVTDTSDNFKFASACAELGMILNDSEYKGTSSYKSVLELAKDARGEDELGIRSEFIQLIDLLKYLDRK